MIPFNKPPYTGNEDKYILQAIQSQKLSGDGFFGKLCEGWFEEQLGCKKALLTPSCTAALEMAAILIDIQPGDEVIMSSYTFVSTANAFVLRGAKIVFVDIRSDTMNIDETKIEAAITEKTKAIVPVHYAGVGCEMDKIMQIADRYNLFVVEDAAQGMMATYNNKPLGSIGHLGCYSFHDTKNYTSGGEGGLLIINDEQFVDRAEIIREKGTNRSQFLKGVVDKYTWIDIGGSYLMNEISAAYLWGQLEKAEDIYENRMRSWQQYYNELKELEEKGMINLPYVPKECVHNAHMFYIKVQDVVMRGILIDYLQKNGIQAVSHYIPLHSSSAGRKFGKFHGHDINVRIESKRIIRLPMFYDMKEFDIFNITQKIKDFFR